ncbi:MAG: histidinol dehydrogenase [Gemmatimonadetes bacterium]|nr:histidinol dehydrogenase [Gemmatimonadota bacterium]
MHASSTDDPELRETVAAILRDVGTRGDAAVLEYTSRFDRLEAGSVAELRVGGDQLASAAAGLDADLLRALERAAENIRVFHERQVDRGFIDVLPDGTILGQRVLPLRRVGVYVPGGQAAYPSSVLMNVVPAKVAGVEQIVMTSPAPPEGRMDPAVLAAAHLAGVQEVIQIGGAQAVGALAYGTEEIGRVDKIVGPGNRWVAEAKRQVFGWVDIDMVAGPSEILVIADDAASPRQVAADLIGQAEHDPDAISWLVTDSARLAAAVPAELEILLALNPRREIALRSLTDNGLILIVPSLEAAAEAANHRAPEHLELLVREPLALLGRIRNAGAIFLGSYSPEPVGDYFAGPNHVLPTGGTARWASPLGVYDFVKRTSLIGYSEAKLRAEAPELLLRRGATWTTAAPFRETEAAIAAAAARAALAAGTTRSAAVAAEVPPADWARALSGESSTRTVGSNCLISSDSKGRAQALRSLWST